MNTSYSTKEEVIVNPAQNKTISDFLELLDRSVAEASRVLKPNKRYTLCFHNKEFKIWKGVLDIFKKYNFVLENIDIVNTKGHSYNKNWAKFLPKTDLYLTFIKSKYSSTFRKKVDISKILSKIIDKTEERDISKIYDILVVKLINELYFNEYPLDISKLDIKQIGEMLNERN